MATPLSIGLLSHLASARSPTGAERSLALLAGGLQQRGHRVVVAAPGPGALDDGLRGQGVPVDLVPSRMCWLAHYEEEAVGRDLFRRIRWAAPGNGRRRLGAWLAQRRPDVVHVNCLPHVHGAVAAHDLGLPVVWHIREILPPGRRRRWFARQLKTRAGIVVAVSEAVAAWLREEGLEARVEVVHNGVASFDDLPPGKTARRALGLEEDGCWVGWFGQLVPHKGTIEFVQAAAAAAEHAPTLRFLIAGAGPQGYLDRVRQTIAAGGHPERFHLIPPVAEIAPLLAAVDVVSLTSTRPDPFPRAVLEAMAAGKPVAAFNSGGTGEMVQPENTGLLTRIGDRAALADALVRLAADESLRTRMGAAGAARAREQFSLLRHLDRMERIFLQVAGR